VGFGFYFWFYFSGKNGNYITKIAILGQSGNLALQLFAQTAITKPIN
jgi:hypothetical protein